MFIRLICLLVATWLMVSWLATEPPQPEPSATMTSDMAAAMRDVDDAIARIDRLLGPTD